MALVSTSPALAAGAHRAHAKHGARAAHARPLAVAAHARHTAQARTPVEELSLSDEFDRAELIDQMLTECRGVKFNAYELAQSTGEALKLPAPIQLMTVRVRHPYCAELLRTYAPKTRV
jgi:hypothetical protein